ncbi:TIR domain-containing protein [Streptomyces cyaneochromogenes]|uniref:TIR domain-containing protein n=1 Tax=Streptomyces cyaneochromogenes TaxID=2496836 RepID=A0A3Q9ENE9_9ACTN|nr:TIR-like protein FxsC [Streptomyces cyaneochromogenes]AZQ32315.1 TIR domain-containing protein [Streptomyces cyaneochromogenes]
MIAALRAALASAGYDPTPEELADILWLAVQPRRGTLREPLSGGPLAEGGPGATAFGTSGTNGQLTEREQAASRMLYASVDWSGTAGSAVSPTRIPTPRALTNARGMARALRPLRSTVRSRTRFRLDVAATVTALADGFRDIILAPAREPLLDLTLLVDDGISMAVWHDVAKEVHQEFHRLRAFRRIRVLGMNTDDPKQVRFTTEPFRHTAPAAHPATGDRSLVLVLTDAVGQAWQTGKAQEHALRWAAKGPTAIFHVLPEDMWPGTGLPTLRLMASASRPAAPNHHIRLRHPQLPRGVLLLPSPPIPVIDIMRGTSARAWAQLVGAPVGESALHFYDPQQLGALPPYVSDDDVVDLPAEDALEEFLACASDGARRLAAHLACAGSALTVPLMRLVQRSAVPESRPEHLAEVFLAGMLTPYKPVTADGADPLPHEAMPWDRRSFAFPPVVAESLRELVRRSDERATHHYVTEYLAQQYKETQAGAALISDPHGVLRARTDLPLGSTVGPGGSIVRGPTGTSRQVSLTSLTVQLNGLMDRIHAPRLDWVHEAVASGANTAEIERVANLLTQATAHNRTAESSGDYTELQRVLEALAHELRQPEMANRYRRAIAALQETKPEPAFSTHAPTPYGDSSETAPYFYLSYARAPRDDAEKSDPDLWVNRLFGDLCDHIRNMTATPGPAGFMDRSVRAGQAWTREPPEALAHCRVFVPLYSPRYFLSSWCGKEWAAFARRRTQYRHEESSTTPSAIVPALWAPVMDYQLPDIAQALQYTHPELGDRYRDFGLYGLIKISSHRSTYQRSVFHLAQRIIEVGESIVVERGDPVDLSALPDAFAPPSSQPPRPDLRAPEQSSRETPRFRIRAEPPSQED